MFLPFFSFYGSANLPLASLLTGARRYSLKRSFRASRANEIANSLQNSFVAENVGAVPFAVEHIC
jgi:hypothetical protein